MKKKIIISVLAVLIVVSSCVGIAINSKLNDDSSTNKADSSTTSNITTTVHTTNETTAKPVETTTKETTTAKSTTKKNSSSQKQSGSSDSLKSNGNSQKQTTKKSATTTKKETTTNAKSYAMSASEIINYALNEIAKVDGIIYTPEFNKDNCGWDTPLVVYPGDSTSKIKEGIKGYAKGVYNKYANGYNVYVENTTDYVGDKCMKVYFLYGHTGPDNVVI